MKRTQFSEKVKTFVSDLQLSQNNSYFYIYYIIILLLLFCKSSTISI